MKFILVALLVGACLTVNWPNPSATKVIGSPITVKAGQTFDGLKQNGNKWVRYERGRNGLGDCTKVEGGKADAVFLLETGATLKNVVLGARSVEHVHCEGAGCTVENVYWEDVCEDALTFENSASTGAKFYVRGGAAKNGSDKIIQHNSAGTVYIENFTVENSGKVYRACGNCKKGYQGKRTVFMTNVTANKVGALAGYNPNFGDTVTLKNVKVNGGHVCRAFQGRNDGKEPTAIGYRCDTQYNSYCICK